jgi:hypothetical protein
LQLQLKNMEKNNMAHRIINKYKIKKFIKDFQKGIKKLRKEKCEHEYILSGAGFTVCKKCGIIA